MVDNFIYCWLHFNKFRAGGEPESRTRLFQMQARGTYTAQNRHASVPRQVRLQDSCQLGITVTDVFGAFFSRQAQSMYDARKRKKTVASISKDNVLYSNRRSSTQITLPLVDLSVFSLSNPSYSRFGTIFGPSQVDHVEDRDTHCLIICPLPTFKQESKDGVTSRRLGV
jgi:hypothetical protein